MKTHHKKSKRQKLSTKYNIQKKIREHRRRLKKQARRMGLQKRVRKDPGIPNSWPFKAEMLAELEAKKAAKDADMEARRAKAKAKAVTDHQQMEIDRREAHKAREIARREKAALAAERYYLETLRRTLPQADVLLCVLDARDPIAGRCAALEAWAQENKKRIIFVLAKADLITPETASKWLLLLGQIAPTVAVQAEAGREGIRELLALLGHAPASAPAGQPKVPAAAAVGVVGYAATGKRALCKAMRQELKATAPWLLDACRLRPKAGAASTVSSALHAAICACVPRGAANATSAAALVASGSSAGITSDVDPVDVVKELLTRVQQQAVLRHFRLPSFEGADAFLKTFCEDRKLKTKKGKVPQPTVIAQRILAELPALPGCFCAPPQASNQGAPNLWSTHAGARQNMELIMQQQVATLSARGVSGPAANALAITSGAGLGPAVDLVGELDAGEEELHIEGEDDVSDSEVSDDDEGMECSEGDEEEEDEGDFEGEEEEFSEAEESEEEMSDDDL